MLAVPVQSGTTFVAGRPRVLFDIELPLPRGGDFPYDIGPDGRFLIITNALM
jgi:hypothetical protein